MKFLKKNKLNINFDIFEKIDIENTAKELSLSEKGTLSGHSEKPPSNSESNDIIENRIIRIIEKEKDQSYDVLNKNFSAFNERLKKLDIESVIQILNQGTSKFKTDIWARFQNIQDKSFFKLSRDIKRKSNDLKNFREANLLSREPNYKESKILWVSIVFIIFLVECISNGYFFAKGHELGYLGGISIALLISIVNVVINSFLIGWLGGRQLVHINWKRKIIGFFSFLFFIIFVPALNLMVAHYRQAYVMQVENPGIAAINTFFDSPFILNDFDSYMLIIMGVAVCIISCIDFWSISDPYPGYEKIYKNLNELQNEYADIRIKLIAELEYFRDEYLGQIKKALKELESNQHEFRLIIDYMNRLKYQIEPHFSRLEQAGRELLSIYRNANRDARTTPAPKRWENEYNLDRPNLDSFLIPSPINVSNELVEARIKIPDIESKINEEYAQVISRIQPLEIINKKV